MCCPNSISSFLARVVLWRSVLHEACLFALPSYRVIQRLRGFIYEACQCHVLVFYVGDGMQLGARSVFIASLVSAWAKGVCQMCVSVCGARAR